MATILHTKNKIHFISLGCPRNLVDTEVMLGILLASGYEVTQELGDADYIVVNTCGFLDASRKESIETLREAVQGKKEGAKVIATGCMVQSHRDEVKKGADIDYMLGSGDAKEILKAVQAEEKGEAVSDARSFLEAGEVPRQISTPRHYAYLKIAEGCRKRCSYCIIPQIKGSLKSKPIERVVQEFRALRKQGVFEIILIAQDLGDFGKDQGHKRTEGLILLLKELLKEKGHFWLRLLYLYPDEITDELIQLIHSDQRICPYLDMPIQHVDDALLKSMHRATNREQIVRTITTLRKTIPSISIRTSLIVGFPGETEEQFEKLKTFLQEYPLDNVGIFKYSKEAKSHSALLPGHLLEEVKQKRLEELSLVQQEVLEKLQTRWLGKTIPVVVEGFHPDSKNLLRGRHRGQCPEIDGEVILNDFRKVEGFGEVYDVKITEILGYDLLGKVVRKTRLR